MWKALFDRVRADIFLVLLPGLALVLGVFWAAIIPLWQIPDEPAHFGYVQSLAEQNTLFPDRHFSRELTATYELSRLVRVPFNPTATQPFVPGSTLGPAEREIVSLPAALRHEIDPETYNSAVAYPPGYYLLASVVYRTLGSQDIFTIMFGLRVFSAILTSITVLFSYLTLRLFFEDRALARAATFLIALSPMYVFMGMAVNVDVLVWLLLSVNVYLLTRALQRGLSRQLNLALASVVGTGLWVKQTLVVCILFYLLLLAFMRFRRSMAWPAIIRFALVFSGVVILMAGWLYLSGSIPTSPAEPARSLSLGGFLAHFIDNWHYYRWALQETFWGTFGWLDTPLSHTLYGVVGFLSLGALVGFVSSLLADAARRKLRPVAVYFLFLILIFGGALSAVNYSVIASGAGWFLQGRYLFPIMAPIFGVLVTGATSFAPGRLKQMIILAAVISIVLFHTTVLFKYVIPRYYL